MDLDSYLSKGTLRIATQLVSLMGPARMLSVLATQKQAIGKRNHAARQGLHVPPFLIASIATGCNLRCTGCYARANGSCHDSASSELGAQQWDSLFGQCEELGIGFILLAGGEPFTKMDVIMAAATHTTCIFPVFTNGTLLDEQRIGLLASAHNIIPMLSIEGDARQTDARRGVGVHNQVMSAMKALSDKQVLFGASVTLTTANMHQVLSPAFAQELQEHGCSAIIYVEYVPAAGGDDSLALDQDKRNESLELLANLRSAVPAMMFLSFPGDELQGGGCLAAGRGFFHINAHGGAEPCPFSPVSDTNVLDVGIEGALRSPLFTSLQSSGILSQAHGGGCVLFGHDQELKEAMDGHQATNCR